jgi:hypothetical protein
MKFMNKIGSVVRATGERELSTALERAKEAADAGIRVSDGGGAEEAVVRSETEGLCHGPGLSMHTVQGAKGEEGSAGRAGGELPNMGFTAQDGERRWTVRRPFIKEGDSPLFMPPPGGESLG